MEATIIVKLLISKIDVHKHSAARNLYWNIGELIEQSIMFVNL